MVASGDFATDAQAWGSGTISQLFFSACDMEAWPFWQQMAGLGDRMLMTVIKKIQTDLLLCLNLLTRIVS